ncbi:MAG: [Fe-Fe] hydrogenase large subunit C-terminal domain-containing protein [Sphaerochaetaceae bacterium]|jgi:iron only hydrogenase large subunit-like protein
MVYPIYTELTQCRDCYKCVRSCPVKAIQVKDGSAVVIKDRCVFCGHCVDVCPNHAKKVRDDIARVQMFLRGGKRVLCSIAPSYAAEFAGQGDAVLAALMRLGFSGVSETAIGAALVSASVDLYAKRNGGVCPWISTACPSVVELVRKYYPQLVGNLSHVPSPLQCHCAYLRELYGEDIGIVFVGPCIAKKVEADTTPGFPDFALTFGELRQWLEREGVFLDEMVDGIEAGKISVPDFVPAPAGKTTLYPVEGGMIASLMWGEDAFQDHAVAISGVDQVIDVLDELPRQEVRGEGGTLEMDVYNDFLELLNCEGGCVNGPGASKGRSPAAKKSLSARYTKTRITAQADKLFVPPAQFLDKLLDKGYDLLVRGDRRSEYPPTGFLPAELKAKFSDAQIDQALKDLGKVSKADELNCGGCGYNTCRDMAVAYLEGMAEPEMCVTKMRKEAQSKIDVLLRTIPMGVVMVDEDLKIVDCNVGFLHLFGDIDYSIESEIINLISGLPLERFVPFYEQFREQFHTSKPGQYRLHYQDKFLRVTFFVVEKQRLVGAIFEDITSPTVRRETVVKKAEDVIQKSLETVQQIASLLGENAAETEIMLNSLIDAFKVPGTDSEDGFLPDEQQDLT